MPGLVPGKWHAKRGGKALTGNPLKSTALISRRHAAAMHVPCILLHLLLAAQPCLEALKLIPA